MEHDSSQIRDCLEKIEHKLNWGSSNQWTNQDFGLLSDEIYQKTSVKLSITTLKRIWGKVEYEGNLSTTTLNVLARYLGFEHWRDYQNKSKKAKSSADGKATIARSKGLPGKLSRKAIVAIIVVLALSSLFFLIDRRQVFYKPDEVRFDSRKVALGLPNTVIFDYDVSKVVADSFFIQQSWDSRRRTRVSPLDSQHTSFYYYPGYFHAKLIANDQIIKQHDVFVESAGWTGMIERFPEPIYIREFLVQNEGILTADLSHFTELKEHYQARDFWVDYYFVKELGDVDANNFIYECRIKNDLGYGSVCSESRISIMCSSGRFNIPLCLPGCVGNINLSLGDKYLQGKDHDLSGLGCELDDWVDFRLAVSNKKCEIMINEEIVLKDVYTADLGKIAGFKFKFNGVGSVDYLRLKSSSGTLLFEEDFELEI